MSKFVVMADWDDAPHLTAEMKREMYDALSPRDRDARSKGIPQLGAGAIYPVQESEITEEPFEIPAHWPRAYALDVGWNRTAAVWGALDRDSSTVHLYSEHYQGQAEPSIHADAIKSRGDWIPGVIDPAAHGRSQEDGKKLFSMYCDLGLELTPAKNSVEAGIYSTYQRLSGGRLKVFKTLRNWLGEFRIYRRDEKGHIVKSGDHLMDCTRYWVMSGIDVVKTKPVYRDEEERYSRSGGWMGS